MTKKIPAPPAKKRRARKKNHYFTQEHEDAIVRYAQTTCLRERTDLYVRLIQPAFNEMVDKIVFTYKFTDLPNIGSLRDECKIWLMTILDKYDQSKGSKAFSYFSVITKNWFIHKVKKQQKDAREKLIMTTWQNTTKRDICRQQNRMCQKEKKKNSGNLSTQNYPLGMPLK